MLDAIQRHLIEEIADLHTVPEGAYNIRANGKLDSRRTTAAPGRASPDGSAPLSAGAGGSPPSGMLVNCPSVSQSP